MQLCDGKLSHRGEVSMIDRPADRRQLACGIFLVLLICSEVSAADPVSSSAGLRRYSNSRWGFCISYPSGWDLQEGFNKAGASFRPPDHLRGGPYIGAGALQNQPLFILSDAPEDENNGRSTTLEENVRFSLKALAEFSKSGVDVIDNSSAVLQGVAARTLTVRYRKDGQLWQDKSIMALKGAGVYSLGLTCPASMCAEYESIFERVVASFTFHCRPATGRRK
jgi:hypothetical protein